MRLTEMHSDLSHGVQSAQCINIDNRDFLFTDVAEFLRRKEADRHGSSGETLMGKTVSNLFENVELVGAAAFEKMNQEDLYKQVYNHIQESLDALSQKIDQVKGTLTVEAHEVMVREFNILKEGITGVLSEAWTVSALMEGVSSAFLDVNALLAILSNPGVKKQVLIAGAAHTMKLEELLKQCGYKELYISKDPRYIWSETIDEAKAISIGFAFDRDSNSFKHIYRLFDLPNGDLKYIDMSYKEIIETFSSDSEK